MQKHKIEFWTAILAFITAISAFFQSCGNEKQIKLINSQIQIISPQINQILTNIDAINDQKNNAHDVAGDNNQTNNQTTVGTINHYPDVAQKTFSDGRYAIGSMITGKRTKVHVQLNEAMAALKQQQYDLAHDHITKALELFIEGKKEAKAYGGLVIGGEKGEDLERYLYTIAYHTAKKLNLTSEANSYLNDLWFGPEETAQFAKELALIGEVDAAKVVLNRVFQKEPNNSLAIQIKEEMKL